MTYKTRTGAIGPGVFLYGAGLFGGVCHGTGPQTLYILAGHNLDRHGLLQLLGMKWKCRGRGGRHDDRSLSIQRPFKSCFGSPRLAKNHKG